MFPIYVGKYRYKAETKIRFSKVTEEESSSCKTLSSLHFTLLKICSMHYVERCTPVVPVFLRGRDLLDELSKHNIPAALLGVTKARRKRRMPSSWDRTRPIRLESYGVASNYGDNYLY